LNSFWPHARVQAPRLSVAAIHTHLALPSLLEKWHIISADAAASYNGFTNTLILKPEMTIVDANTGTRRVRTIPEIREVLGTPARVSVGTIFHELSHAEYDLYVEEGDEDYDRELMLVLNAELPAIISMNGLSVFKSIPLASEIFAYYRAELIGTILQDTAEIKLASGLDPDIDICTPLKTLPLDLRNFSASPVPYAKRVKLTEVFVSGEFVNLNLDKALNARLNEALFKHSLHTLHFPESRVDLLKQLSRDTKIRAAMAMCRASRADH
jgi:hypothetical protein